MLIKCPKCGFDQPKDTYCANCGIEVDSFKPVQPPFWKTAIKSPWFSLLLFVGLGYGAYMYLKNPSQFQFSASPPPAAESTPSSVAESGKSSVPTPPSSTNPSSVPISPHPAPSDPAGTSGASAPAPPPSLASPPPPPPDSQASKSARLTTAAPPAPSAEPGVKTTPHPPEENEKIPTDKMETSSPRSDVPIESITGPLVVEIRFVEAPQAVVQGFLAEASDNSGGDSGEMSYAIVKNASSWLNHKSFKELDRFTKSVPDITKKLQWFSGTHEPSSRAPFGVDFQISIQARSGGHLAGDIFLSRSMVEHNPEGAVTTQRKDFTTHFETDVGSVIGLAGVMPRIRYKAEDKDPLQDSLLKIFLSPAFLDGETDLLILMQFKSAK